MIQYKCERDNIWWWWWIVFSVVMCGGVQAGGGLSNSLLPAKSSAIQSLLSCLRAASSLLVASVWARVNIRSMRYIDRVRLYMYTYYINYPYCLCPLYPIHLLYVHSVVRIYPLISTSTYIYTPMSHIPTQASAYPILPACVYNPRHTYTLATHPATPSTTTALIKYFTFTSFLHT